jgi:hypothetical protein
VDEANELLRESVRAIKSSRGQPMLITAGAVMTEARRLARRPDFSQSQGFDNPHSGSYRNFGGSRIPRHVCIEGYAAFSGQRRYTRFITGSGLGAHSENRYDLPFVGRTEHENRWTLPLRLRDVRGRSRPRNDDHLQLHGLPNDEWRSIASKRQRLDICTLGKTHG